MKNKIKIFIIMILCMLFLKESSYAKVVSYEEVKNVTTALGIMQGYDDGTFGDNDFVTRSQLSKILVTSSKYRKLVSEKSATSPFCDVKYNHWAAPYVNVCVSAGYLTGCADGTYKPEDKVLYEEALCALLRVLGYENSEIIHNYPYGVIALAEDIGLNENLNSVYARKILTRKEMAILIYNTLNANVKNSNQKLLSSLGYEVNGDEISSIDIIYEDSIGPYIVLDSSWKKDLNVLPNVKILKNGREIRENLITEYDVLYYSKNLNTLWVYDEKIVGTYQKASPNREKIEKVTISGKEYEVSGLAKTYFSYGNLSYGLPVTLICDREGIIIDVITSTNEEASTAGIVTNAGTKTFTSSNEDEYSGYYVDIINLQGNEYTYEVEKDLKNYIGKVVRITFSDEDVNIKLLNSTEGVLGKVDVSREKIGNFKYAANLTVVEYNTFSNQISKISIDRIDGYTLSKSDILYVSKNANEEIEYLVITDMTYDSYSSAYILSSGDSENKSYIANISGKSYNLPGDNYKKGAALIALEGNSVSGVRSIASYSISNIKEVTDTYVVDNDEIRYQVGTECAFYRVKDGKLLVTNKEEITKNDSITAYFDFIPSKNSIVRVIVIK